MSASPDVTSARVLVVDDDTMLRNLLYEVLSAEGHAVDRASTGEEALDMLDVAPYDLVITDVVMPGISGVDVLRGARRKYPDIDVVVMTGYATVDTAIRSIRLGAVDYITKPFNLDHIRVLVSKTVELRRMREERVHAVETSEQAGIDVASGLYNRKLFLDLIQGELTTAARAKHAVSLVVLELMAGADDQFDPNSWMKWITMTAWTLRRIARANDRIGRLGPTTFGVALSDIDTIDVMIEQERITSLLANALQTKTFALRVLAGSATYPHDEQDVLSLLHAAERNCTESGEEISRAYRNEGGLYASDNL